MINEKMAKALNEQINKEFYSSYLYLQMAAYFEEMGLKGFANWMKVQAQEESTHAHKFYNYLLDRGGKVVLETIQKPEDDFKSVIDVFERVLNHEVYVNSLINSLMDVAEELKDRASMSFLKWFIDEQVEEEANCEDIIAQLKIVDCSGDALFMMDREMAQRVFVDNTQN